MIRKDPRDWEALYRQGEALAELGKTDEAAQRFRALLDAADRRRREERDHQGAAAATPSSRTEGARQSSISRKATMPLEDRLGAALQIRAAMPPRQPAVLRRERPGHGLGAAGLRPGADGRAGLAGQPGRSARCRQGRGGRSPNIARRPRRRRPTSGRSGTGFTSASCGTTTRRAYKAARDLTRATPTDPLALWAYLYSLGGRQLGLGSRYYVYPGRDTLNDSTPPLEKDELDHVLACYQSLRARRPELAQAQIAPERLRRAEAGQAGRGRRAVLSRRDRPVARSSRRSPASSAWRPSAATSRVSDPAPRPLRAAPGGPEVLATITPAVSTSQGPARPCRRG